MSETVEAFTEVTTLGNRVLAGALLDSGRELFAELDAMLPPALLDIGLDTEAFIGASAMY